MDMTKFNLDEMSKAIDGIMTNVKMDDKARHDILRAIESVFIGGRKSKAGVN